MGGTGNGGTAFELTPSDNGWTYTLLYALPGLGQGGPLGPLVMDADGNLYGTSYADPDPVMGMAVFSVDALSEVGRTRHCTILQAVTTGQCRTAT